MDSWSGFIGSLNTKTKEQTASHEIDAALAAQQEKAERKAEKAARLAAQKLADKKKDVRVHKEPTATIKRVTLPKINLATTTSSLTSLKGKLRQKKSEVQPDAHQKKKRQRRLRRKVREIYIRYHQLLLDRPACIINL